MNAKRFTVPTFDDVKIAAERLKGNSVLTPLIESTIINERVGGRVLIKVEALQRTGSFKFRGAFNKIKSLSEVEKKNGVIAYSSGNHAQGVASAAALCGINAKILMPSDAPKIKIERTKALGANVILYDRQNDDRHAMLTRIISETCETVIHPYDDLEIIAGQGTVGLELMRQAYEINVIPDNVLVSCGGGGLVAGVATAVKHMNPKTEVHCVEPDGFDETRRSLEHNKCYQNTPGAKTICDALQSNLGELTFHINSQLLSGGISVNDVSVYAAMKAAFSDLKLIIEPGGAVTLAAIFNGSVETKGRITVAVVSGGNVDPELYSKAILS